MSINRRTRGYDSYSDEDDFDGYEKPLSRRDRDRMYKSDNDLGKRVRETSTQTLRETATQTGQNESVVVKSPLVVKKRRRPRSVSTAGTQTVKKESKAKTRSTDRLNESMSEPEKKKRTKTKRSKSANALNALDSTDSDKSEKPKPRPKPKPRKSTSADTHLEDQPEKSANQENEINAIKNPYYPGSEGFAPQPYPPQGYQIMPPVIPGYQGQPGMPTQQYPNHPPSHAPPSYPGYHNTRPVVPQMVNNIDPRHQVPKQRNKSNWEMLCEMTDGQRPRDDVTETGSVASSVFTNNAVGYPDYGNPPGNPHYNNQQFYNYPPQPTYPVPPHLSIPDYENTEFRANGAAKTGLGKQSSWDTLKVLTDPAAPRTQGTVEVKNSRSESIV